MKENLFCFGNPEEFAIKINLMDIEKFSGYSQFVIHGKTIGSFQDKIFLLGFYDAIARVKNLSFNSYVKRNLNKFSEPASFNRLSHNVIGSQMLLGLTENYDDFDIRVFVFQEYVYFIWKLLESPFFEYDGTVVGKVYMKRIKVCSYKNAVAEFYNIIKNYHPLWDIKKV